ncbi:cation:proton antiporter [Candidatus Bathyarchaeota archaeon]|nr:cation:proton antiporter [Candidatus Bathyarchaeota archaeon]MBS7630604.1 cation:proton antiporter [Candidatus Bathyarchaeota archaeon]
MINATNIVLLVSATLLLGYLGQLFYNKTNIPDFIWLLAFGFLLGPLTHMYDSEVFISLSSLMSMVALSIILFQAGIESDIKLIIKALPKALILIGFTFTLIVLFIGSFLHLILPRSFTLLQGLLFGTMIGGTSTVTTLGILESLERKVDIQDAKVVLVLESVLTDPICIISAITLIKMIMQPGVSFTEGLEGIFLSFGMASTIGLTTGIIWSTILSKLKGKRLNYMITIAVLFITYIISEEIAGNGSGPISALVFGLILVNIDDLLKAFGSEKLIVVDITELKNFHEEVTFFIKSFFFVYVGLIISLSIENVVLGLTLTGICLAIRYVAVSIISRIIKLDLKEKTLFKFVFAQGLPAFIMSQLPLIFDPNQKFFQNPEIYTELCFIIVLGTVIYGAILGPYLVNRKVKT